MRAETTHRRSCGGIVTSGLVLCASAGSIAASVTLLVAASGCTFDTSGLAPIEDAGPNSYECGCACGSEDRVLTSAPASSEDDAEEVFATNAVFLSGLVLDFAEVEGQPQVVGIRFPNLGIPRGATIVSAHVQASVFEATDETTNLALRAEAADDAAPFVATSGNVTGRPTTAAIVGWSPPPWSTVGEAGPDQRTPDLATLVQEVVDRPGWGAGNALALLISGAGRRAAVSFDTNPAAAPRLEIVYREPAISVTLPVCVPEELNPNIGASPEPSEAQLAADCQNRVENTMRGLALSCGYPGLCDCDLTAGSARFAEVCDDPCVEEPLDADCENFDPEEGAVTATNAPGDAPVCTVASPLAASLFGRHSTCLVEGEALVEMGDESRSPAASGVVDIAGDPCPGGSCSVGISYRLDLEAIRFERLFRSATFEDLAAVGRSLSGAEAELSAAGSGGFAPGATLTSGRGRRGSESRGVVATNDDVIDIGVSWDPAAAACTLEGALIGTVDPELKRCEEAGPSAGELCDDDEDCIDDDECSEGLCSCEPVEPVGMTLAVSLQGPIVNQPPAARAGADQVVECNLPGQAKLTLDGSASHDPDDNLASVT